MNIAETIDFSPLKPFMHKLDAAFSDLDGTLVDNEGHALDQIGGVLGNWVSVVCDKLDIHPHIKINGFGNIRHMAGQKLSEIRQFLGELANVTLPDHLDDEILKLRGVLPLPGEVAAISPVAQFFQFAKDLNTKRMIVTSSEAPRALGHAHAAGITHLFDLPHDLFSAHTMLGPGRSKPDPDCYMAALAIKGASPENTITFEDTLAGVSSAHATGISAIGILLGNHIPAHKKDEIAAELKGAGAVAVIKHENEFVRKMRHVLENKIPSSQTVAPQFLPHVPDASPNTPIMGAPAPV